MEKKLKRKFFHEQHAIWKWQWWAKVWEDTKKIAINKTKFSLMASFHKFLHIHVVHSTSATTARMMTLFDKDKNGKLFQWSWEYKDKLHLFCFFFLCLLFFENMQEMTHIDVNLHKKYLQRFLSDVTYGYPRCSS